MGAAAESVFTFLFKYSPRLFERGDVVLAPVVPGPALALAALVTLALVVLAYRRLRGISRADRLILGGVRALALAIVLACLLRPTLMLSTAVAQRNVLAVLLDDSRSMRLADWGGRPRAEAAARLFASDAPLRQALDAQFAVRAPEHCQLILETRR